MGSVLLHEEADSIRDEARSGPPVWAWGLALALLTLLFFLPFFNRFAGLRSGNGEFTTGLWFLQGKLPYRDYFSATPPLNTLKSAALLRLFGPLLMVSRAAGVVERIGIALVMFHWLRRLFPTGYAFVASVVTIILSSGDLTDPIASYNHDAVLLAMLSGLAASYVLERRETGALMGWSALSGVCAGSCMATKQTVGLGAAVAVPVAVAILLANAGSWRRAGLWVTGFAAGCAVPLLLLAAWLHHLHVLGTFLNMAFLKGPAAKAGHASDFLVRDWLVVLRNARMVKLAVLAIALCAVPLYRSQRLLRGAAGPTVAPLPSLATGLGLALLAADVLAFTRLRTMHDYSRIWVYFAFVVTGAQMVAYALACLGWRLSARQRQFALFSAVSFWISFFLSLSWPAFELMMLPGFALLIALLLEGVKPRWIRPIYAVLGLAVFLQMREKLDLPFFFGGLFEEPVRTATQPSRLPELRGMRLPPDMNRLLEGTVETIQQHSSPGDTIFTYPEMSLLYSLTGRGYPTLAGSHNVDVVSDAMAAEEASRILTGQPAVVVYMPLDPSEVKTEDELWRFGKPSGQHLLVSAVERLTSGYRLAGVYTVGKPGRPIMVYVRP